MLKLILICGFLFMNLLTVQAIEAYKVATVDMKKIFDAQIKKHPAQAKIKEKLAAIKKENQRKLDEITATHARIKKLSNTKANYELNKNEILRLENMSRVDDKTLRERRKWLEAQNKSINRAIITETREVLKLINSAIESYAKKHDIDFIFDLSAEGKDQSISLVFSQDEHDITEDIIQYLTDLKSLEETKK